MTFLVSLLGTIVPGFFLIFQQKKGAISFGLYDISRSLTPLGWALIIILLLSLTFGISYLARKIFNRSKLK